jgi:chromate transporter
LVTDSGTRRRSEPAPAAGTVAEVFVAFLKLGLTSFGGPIAHLGYMHRELVTRRRWVDDAQYAQLVALCQLLPGPASSQLGFALGLIRAGWLGAVIAFVTFTLPSAALLFLFAHLLPALRGPVSQAAIHGLKLVAVAVVAQGLLLMVKRLTPDAPRALIAAGAGAVVAMSDLPFVQLLVIGLGAILGLVFCRHTTEASGSGSLPLSVRKRTGVALVSAFALLLASAIATEQVGGPLASVAAAFYRAGALVFGGGHVVLPLLEDAVVAPGWVSEDAFLAGYGAAQAVPGPVFSIAAFLGARLEGAQGGLLGAVVGTLAIFLPGLLLVAGALPLWHTIANRSHAISAVAGVNAAVVGLLAAALYDPLWTSAVLSPVDFAVVLIAFALLTATRVSVLIVILWTVAASLVPVWFTGTFRP